MSTQVWASYTTQCRQLKRRSAPSYIQRLWVILARILPRLEAQSHPGPTKELCKQRGKSSGKASVTPWVDHALDLAKLTSQTSLDNVEVLILDFKDAFMSLALADSEKPYNCSVLESPLTRSREPLFDGEVTSGTCIVWRVLVLAANPTR